MSDGWDYVTDEDGLARVAESIRGADCIGIDTESDSFFHYRERVCLLQLTANDHDWIVDPLAVGDLEALRDAFADPSIVKVLHGADYDLTLLQRDGGFTLTPVFDTMLAAQALGYERYSLADLVARFFDVELDKRYQRQDWSRRPLKDEHLEYARLDSHYLPRLRDLLWADVVEHGREAQVLEECRLLETRERVAHEFTPDDFLRIRGAGALDDPAKRVLRSLSVMRDEMARRRDRPHFKVLGNEILLRLARRPPVDHDALVELFGPKHHVVRRHADRVLEAVRRGMKDRSAVPRSRPDSRPGRRLTAPDEQKAFDKLRKWRNGEAKRRGIEPGVLLPNAVLQEIAAGQPRALEDLAGIDGLRDWQRDELGETLVELVNPSA